MPAPTTVAELLDLVQKSGVVEAPRLAAYVEHLRAGAALPADPIKLASQMVRDGYLTHFQREQILLGKWKRFSIGKYKVLERLGSGGMGQVYLCEHKVMRRKVAVKVLPTAKAQEPSSLDRFHREARAVAALDHPNLVRAFDIDQDGDLNFLVMEYVDGASLQEMVKKSGPLDPTRACHYVYHAAEGLQYAYEVAELVHRDVKPGNIMVDRQGVVKLLDMGLARFFNDETDILTKKYDESVLGTADYLSPEQATDSHGVDIRADIYSLGATFYFMLTGQAPFAEGSVAQKLIWHQTRQPKPVRLLRPVVPEGVSAIIERMMMKDPAARYQTPAELAGALSQFVQTPIPPPPESEMPRLSPAAGGGAPAAVGAAPALSPPGRWPMPPGRATAPAAIASATAQATNPRPGGNPPGRTPPTTHKPSQPPRPEPAGPTRRDEVNPFAHLLGSGPPAGPSHNVYATAASRAAAVSLPVPTRAPDAGPLMTARSNSVLTIVAVTAGLLAIAGGAFAVWRLTIGLSAGWW
jgi:serine/threonine protein kinase